MHWIFENLPLYLLLLTIPPSNCVLHKKDVVKEPPNGNSDKQKIFVFHEKRQYNLFILVLGSMLIKVLA